MGTTSPHDAEPQRSEQQAFVPWSSLVNANEDVAKREAGKLQSQVQGDVSKAQGDLTSAQTGFNAGIDSNYLGTPKPTGGTSRSESRAAAGSADNSANARRHQTPSPAPTGPTEATPDTLGTSNPWATLSGDGASAGAAPQAAGVGDQRAFSVPPAYQPPPTSNNVAGTAGAAFGLTPTAAASPAGAKDLEASAGAPAWSTLLADTGRATAEAKALGSETGVQGLLQQGQTAPLPGDSDPARAGIMDAALINGQGQHDFQKEADQYGGNQLAKGVVDAETAAQNRWKSLQGDVTNANSAADALRDSKGGRARPDLSGQGANQEPRGPDGQAAPGDQPTSIDDVLFGDGAAGAQFWADFHQAGLSLSPADWAAVGLGESGIDTPMPTEMFAGAEGGSGAKATGIEQSWPPAKVKWAFNMVDDMFGPDAMQALAKGMHDDPALLQMYLGMNNPGFIARNMRAWLESKGFQSHGQVNIKINHGPAADDTSRSVGGGGENTGDASTSTTDEQENARILAYQQGWGTEYDEQFRNGNKNPQRK